MAASVKELYEIKDTTLTSKSIDSEIKSQLLDESVMAKIWDAKSVQELIDIDPKVREILYLDGFTQETIHQITKFEYVLSDLPWYCHLINHYQSSLLNSQIDEVFPNIFISNFEGAKVLKAYSR